MHWTFLIFHGNNTNLTTASFFKPVTLTFNSIGSSFHKISDTLRKKAFRLSSKTRMHSYLQLLITRLSLLSWQCAYGLSLVDCSSTNLVNVVVISSECASMSWSFIILVWLLYWSESLLWVSSHGTPSDKKLIRVRCPVIHTHNCWTTFTSQKLTVKIYSSPFRKRKICFPRK